MYAITPNLASHSQPHRVSRKEMARTSEPRRGARTETSSINRYETVGKCTSAKAHTYSYGSPKQQSFQGWWLVVAVAVEGFEVEIAKKNTIRRRCRQRLDRFLCSLSPHVDGRWYRVCMYTQREKQQRDGEKPFGRWKQIHVLWSIFCL